MDGSAAPFIYLIQRSRREAAAGAAQVPEGRSGRSRCRAATSGSRSIRRITSRSPTASASIIRCCAISRGRCGSPKRAFVEEIAPARTFGFLKEVEMLRQNGLALGGSLENAIVLGETGVLNNALRFEDEFVRHKILDVDRRPGAGRLSGHRPPGRASRRPRAAHRVRRARSSRRRDAWRLVEAPVDGAPRRPTASPSESLRRGWRTELASTQRTTSSIRPQSPASRYPARPHCSVSRQSTSADHWPSTGTVTSRQLLHVRLELVVLVVHGVEEQALGR